MSCIMAGCEYVDAEICESSGRVSQGESMKLGGCKKFERVLGVASNDVSKVRISWLHFSEAPQLINLGGPLSSAAAVPACEMLQRFAYGVFQGTKQ